MFDARRIDISVLYNNVQITGAAGSIGTEIEKLTYVDSAADNSDSVDITLDAQDDKWINGWMPEKGATISAVVDGLYWNHGKGMKTLRCGLFTLDDLSYNDMPSTIQISGVSKPSNSDFSELERECVWKNTSIKRIGADIAARYGMTFVYDADDYEIESIEQDDTDSSFYNDLCKDYGLILKVYSKQLWIYDREKYKEKPAVKTYDREGNIIRGSFNYTTTLAGTYTGGYFTYTDADKDQDIKCSIGGGSRTKSINQRATSVLDASIQLCAALNNANHEITKISFKVPGEWTVSAANNINLSGYGKLDGKYFVNKITHSFDRSGGFTSKLECCKIVTPFHYWEVGGTIEKHEKKSKKKTKYSSTYETTSPSANADSSAGGAVAGKAVNLSNAPFYYTSAAQIATSHKSGTYYFYDGILVNGRYRMTNMAARCGKLPVGKNVTGWVPAENCK